MRKILLQAARIALCGGMMALSGCGGGDDEPQKNATTTSPPDNTTTTTGDFAPASIGNHTIDGHIGGTSTTWQIVTTGGTSGSYTYSENGKYLNSGDYTWTKTSDSSGVLALSPSGTTMDLNYTAPKQGNYVYHANANYNEPGTFTTN